MTTLSDRLKDEINTREQAGNFSTVDLLELPESLTGIMGQLVRGNGLSIKEIADILGQSVPETETTMAGFIEKGYVIRVNTNNQICYKANFGRKAGKTTGIWSLLTQISNETY